MRDKVSVPWCWLLVGVLLFSGGLVVGQNECEQSELGYSCRKQMTDYFALHWSLGPTTAGAEASDGEIAIAMVGETEGWVGFAFAEVAGAMAPADFVIGWVNGSDVVANPYRSEFQFINADNEDDLVTLRSIEGSEENGQTTIRFVRSLTDGTTEILVDEEIPVNVAIRTDDQLLIHTQREPNTVMLMLALEANTSTPTTESEEAEAPGTSIIAPVSEAPEQSMDRSPPSSSDTPTPDDQSRTVTERATDMDGGCIESNLGYGQSTQLGQVTLHWTIGPQDANGEAPEVNDGEIAITLVAETDGWIGIGFAESTGQMAPADVVLGWVSGGTASINGYSISGQSISADQATENIGLRELQGSEVNGLTTLQFILTGQFTRPVDFTQNVNLNAAVGPTDSLIPHSYRNGFTLNFLTCASSVEAQDLTEYRAHGAMMIIAWIVLAPLGVLIARNKYVFAGISEGAWFQIHRFVQILALTFMFIGMVIALSEFSDPASTEGKRHRRVGIAILTIGFFQGAVPFFRPKHESPYRFFFNFFHGYLGRGAVILGIATVFLGINAYDILNDGDVDIYWIPCLVILSVYFALAVIGEIILAYKQGSGHHAKAVPSQDPGIQMSA
eukprot:g2015.t1